MRKLFIISLIAFLGASTSAAEEKKLYRWVDAEGNVHFSDKVPAEVAERPKTVVNDQGVAVGELEGKKTDEQLAQEAKDRELAAEQKKQSQRDRMLLATYLSVEEIELHRDRRVELFRAQARVTDLYLKNLQRRLDELREEASNYQPYSKDENAPMIDSDLAADLDTTKETIARHVRNLQEYQAEETKIVKEFEQAIARFKVLKGIEGPEQTASTSP